MSYHTVIGYSATTIFDRVTEAGNNEKRIKKTETAKQSINEEVTPCLLKNWLINWPYLSSPWCLFLSHVFYCLVKAAKCQPGIFVCYLHKTFPYTKKKNRQTKQHEINEVENSIDRRQQCLSTKARDWSFDLLEWITALSNGFILLLHEMLQEFQKHGPWTNHDAHAHRWAKCNRNCYMHTHTAEHWRHQSPHILIVFIH